MTEDPTDDELANWLDSLSDAQLRQMAEDADEAMGPILRQITAVPSGTFNCLRCSATASWTRTGREWHAKCPDCEWGAAGMLAAISVAN